MHLSRCQPCSATRSLHTRVAEGCCIYPVEAPQQPLCAGSLCCTCFEACALSCLPMPISRALPFKVSFLWQPSALVLLPTGFFPLGCSTGRKHLFYPLSPGAQCGIGCIVISLFRECTLTHSMARALDAGMPFQGPLMPLHDGCLHALRGVWGLHMEICPWRQFVDAPSLCLYDSASTQLCAVVSWFVTKSRTSEI